MTRDQLMAYRVHAHQLDRDGPRPAVDADVLDLGVQDTGPDGALWSLASRGVSVSAHQGWPPELVLLWTVRGAPHAYRRADLPAVARAVAPTSEADAAKRIFDAARPLRAAGLPVTDALARVTHEMRDIVVRPTVKGDVSGALTDRLGEPFTRFCRPCDTTHVYEMPFRLSALPAGLELTPGTSPPVLRRVPGWTGPATTVPPRLEVVRAFLHLNGPATPKLVAAYLDAPVKEVRARWPADTVELRVDGEPRWILAEDVEALSAPPAPASHLRLLSPFDPLLQTQDRTLLVPDDARRKQLWVVLGRPGAILRGADLVGTWRPRASGRRLGLEVDRWQRVPDDALVEQAERLAAHRGLSFAGLSDRVG